MSCLLRWVSGIAAAFPAPHRGSPFPSVPMGLLGSRSCPFVVGCQERASSLYSFQEWARVG